MAFEIYNADALLKLSDIKDKSIDLIFSDLPQGITKNYWDKPIDLKSLWSHCERIIKTNGAIIFMTNQPYTSSVVQSNLKMFKYSMVYEKTSAGNFLNAKKQPLRSHEDILIFYKKQPTYNPQKTTGHPRKISTAHHKRNCVKTTNYNDHGFVDYDSTERYPKSILRFKKDVQKSKLNATQKPVDLVKWFINTFTNEGDTVLDLCMGSGTTIIASEETHRYGIGIEKYLNEFEKAKNRIYYSKLK